MPNYIKIILLVVLILLFLLSSIFSGSETAYTSISAAKVMQMVESKERGAKLVQRHLKKYNQVLSTVLIGNNIVNISSSTLTSLLLSQIILNDQGLVAIVATLVVTPIIVLIGEIMPKMIAKANPFFYLKNFSWLIEFFNWVFFIIAYPISKLGKKVYITNSEDELKTMIDIAKEEGVLQKGESLLAQNALDLDSMKVTQHYVKLKEVVTIKYNSSIEEALEVFKDSNYSRLPVESKDGKLIGIVILKDIYHLKRGKVIDFIKSVPYISANSILSSALEKMRYAKAQMAFVVENNSSTDVIGIITIEDIIEELVGEIYDETDEVEDIYEISLEKSRVKSNALMKDIFKQLELDIDKLDEDELNLTLSEWMLNRSKRVRLIKNLKYTFEDVATFKVIETKNKNNKYAVIEVNRL